MAVNDGFYWSKNVLKKQLKLVSRIYLSIAIVLSPIFLMTSANASSVGGWSMGNPIAQGASTIYEGTKNVLINGADYVKKGAATITPSASNVAKTLGKGVAGVAVSVAVEQLLGAVDYVLDPANNQIRYTDPNIDCTANSSCPLSQYLFRTTDIGVITVEYKNNSDYATNVCNQQAPAGYSGKAKFRTLENFKSGGFTCVYDNSPNVRVYWGIVANPAYDPAAEKEEKTIPLDVLVQQVISNAAAGDTAAQAATTAAAADIVAEAETDSVKARPIVQQLEATASTKPADEAAAAQSNTATGTQTQNPTKPETSDLALEFPTFCGWSPLVCEAAQVVISFPQTLTDWWEAAKEWATSEPQEKEPENLDFEDLEIDASDVNLSASSNCPQDSVSFSVMGKSVTLDMPYQPVCDALNFFKPAVLLVGAVASVYIVAGVRTKEEDQP